MKNKTLLENIKALLFDMDGTLVDNIAYHEKAWITFCRRHGVELKAKVFRGKFFGKDNRTILRKLFGTDLSSREINRLAGEKERLYRNIYAPHIRPMRGAVRLIERARKNGLKIAMTSSAPRQNRKFVLKALRLKGLFDLIVGEEDILNGKPHPEIYIKAVKKLRLSPGECLAFEDSRSGVQSAKRAGLKVVGILSGFPRTALSQADRIIKDFMDFSITPARRQVVSFGIHVK